MRTWQEIVEEFKQKRNQHNYVTTSMNKKIIEIDELQKEIEEENNKLDQINNILLACKLMLEKITYQNKAKIEQFITYALQQIFTDRDYSIELEVKEDVKRPALTLMLIENGVKQEINNSVGGGIITTLGFLLQIYYLEVYNKSKIMFIDEGLKEISKTDDEEMNVNYLRNMLNFLKWLSTDRGYKFVIVTHDDSIREVADSVYKVKQGDVVKVK